MVLQRGSLTIKLLKHALDSAGATATAHGNVELVCVGHGEGCGWCVGLYGGVEVVWAATGLVDV